MPYLAVDNMLAVMVVDSNRHAVVDMNQVDTILDMVVVYCPFFKLFFSQFFFKSMKNKINKFKYKIMYTKKTTDKLILI
jgi:hypothetical protein